MTIEQLAIFIAITVIIASVSLIGLAIYALICWLDKEDHKYE